MPPTEPTSPRIITATITDTAAAGSAIAVSAWLSADEWRFHVSEAHDFQMQLYQQAVPVDVLRAQAHSLDVLRVGLRHALPAHALGVVAL